MKKTLDDLIEKQKVKRKLRVLKVKKVEEKREKIQIQKSLDDFVQCDSHSIFEKYDIPLEFRKKVKCPIIPRKVYAFLRPLGLDQAWGFYHPISDRVLIIPSPYNDAYGLADTEHALLFEVERRIIRNKYKLGFVGGAHWFIQSRPDELAKEKMNWHVESAYFPYHIAKNMIKFYSGLRKRQL